jgi:hypothetical protein
MLSVLKILFLCFSINFALADTVRILNVSKLTSLTGQTNRSIDIFSEAPSGDATSESAPAKIYVPITTTTTATTTDYYYLNSTAGPNKNLFGYTATGASKATFETYTITFPLVLSVNSTVKYLYAAVKTNSTYVVVAKYGTPISSVTNTEYDFPVSPQSICQGAAAGSVNCSNFDDNIPASVSENPKVINIYFFVSSDNLIVGSADIGAPSATYGDGVFFQVNMSNQVYSNSELHMSLTDLRKGDRRLIGNFTSTSTMTFAYKGTYAYIHASNVDTCISIREPGRCQGSFTADPVASTQSAEFTLAQLTNGVELTISVGSVDKFGFSTTLSNSIKGTPIEIQQLLKKQACFLLTAGFGEEHYIITYFRNFRDQVLENYSLGRMFIGFYYETAPKYALIIYKSPLLRSGIRGVAYILYFIFSYIKLLSIGLITILSFIIFNRAKRWRQQKRILPF